MPPGVLPPLVVFVHVPLAVQPEGVVPIVVEPEALRNATMTIKMSPAFTVADGKTSTSALLDTCFRQVEYAGVLAGAQNPDGAQAFVDFLLTPEVQAALPDSMYVFPVDPSVALPKQWASFAQQPTDPYEVDPAQVSEHRDEWLREWSDVTSR